VLVDDALGVSVLQWSKFMGYPLSPSTVRERC